MKTVITKRLGYLTTTESLLSHLGDVVWCDDQEPATVRAALADADIVVATKGVTIDDAVLDAAPNLRIVAAPTAGFDWIDVDAATRHGVPVISNIGAAADAPAEFAIASVLAWSRRIVSANRDFAAGAPWAEIRDRYSSADRNVGNDLSTSTVAIFGLGNIGLKTAEKIRVFRPGRVIGYDPFISSERAAEVGVELVADLHEAARLADIVILHVPLTKSTEHLVDAAFLAELKPSAYLVNVSRGEVVDEPALVAALQEQRIAGAALDVFEHEPLPDDSPLRSLPTVTLTPHIAGVTAQSDRARAQDIAERILQALDGVKPAGLMNAAVWESHLATTAS